MIDLAELEKLEIEPLDDVPIDAFEVLFNPNSYSISKSVNWGGSSSAEVNAPTLTFGGGASRTLSLELFYDVTEPVRDDEVIDDVRKETNKMVALTRIQRDLHRPPVVQITWGDDSGDRFDFPFIGVVAQLTQRFTLFRSDGKPVRATLSVSFREFCDVEKDQRQTDPEFTTRLVKRGDTLSNIAADVYRDQTLWRVIAEANQLDDPRRLAVGSRLILPKIG
jgi:hypothetical protein